jgi:hypothetical protein
MILIGLNGWSGSGKDEAAKGLVKLGFTQFAFADEVKRALLILDPHLPSADASPQRLSDHLFKRCGGDWNVAKQHPEVRLLLQRLGTEVGREFISEDIWVDRVRDRMLALMTSSAKNDRHFVITDVRFHNEADMIRSAGGLVWRIERPGNRPATGSDGSVHPSETTLDNYSFDLVITNAGSIEDLHRSVVLAYEAER